MLKKTLLAITLAGLSTSAFAQWEMSVGYVNLSDEVDDGVDFSLDALTASIGNQFPIYESFMLVPEFRVGFGIGDDTYEESDTFETFTYTNELDSYYGVALRAVFDTASGVYIFAVPSFTKAKFGYSRSVSFNGETLASDS